ncbi:uncharacterized protein LOC143250809 isoform X2 [Tachypleus tridentatus]|uniref:uncharacterized protein LOC143250809 isoform X2 n=1 Tax=Tachypleus tridentatus TaxID=6853 RepID=UPI003FD1498C
MNKEKNIAVPSFSYLQQNGKPKRFTSYFSDMATWIRKDVCEAIDSGLLNIQMTGPRHCEVVKCEKRKIEDTSGSYIKRITDNQTSIIAVFLKEAVDEMLQKRLEEPEDSEINWEEGVVILEKYRIIYLSLPESKTGTFAIQVDKFDYLGEPLSSLMKDYPFVIQRSEDDPELQKKCQDFEQKFAVKQTSLDTLRLKQAQAPDSLLHRAPFRLRSVLQLVMFVDP